MSASVTLTVPSGKVASDLTAFVVKVSLADMPDNFWLAFDGGNVRVKQAGSDVPFDVVAFDTGAKTGELYFKASLATATSNVFTVEAIDGAVPPAVTDTNGRNAVWSDYDWAGSFFDDAVDRTGNGHDAVVVGTVASEFGVATTVNSNGHWSQGVAYDGTNWYSTSTNEIRKYGATFTQTAIQSDPIAASGLSGVNHCGDPAIKGGELFVPIEVYPSSPYANQRIAVFNLSDLSWNRNYDISAQAHEASSIVWNNDASEWIVTSFDGPSDTNVLKLFRYNSSWTYLGSLTLPTSIPYKQGIAWKSGFYYIMSGPTAGGGNLWKVATDMSTAVKVWTGTGSEKEGLEIVGNDLYYGETGGTNHLQKLPYVGTTGEVGWLTLAGSGNAEVASLHKRTSWTMGATVKIAAVPTSAANRTVLSYSDNSSTDGNRASLVARGSTAKYTIWNSTDAFASGTTIVSGDIGVRKRLHHTQNTTTDRKLFLTGTADATDTGTAQRPAGGSDGTMKLFIGAEDTSYAERWNGKIGGLIYLRNGVLSADWISAEVASWEGSSFYTAVATPIVATVDGVISPVTGSATMVLGSTMTVDGVVPDVTGSVAITSPGLELTVSGVVPDVTGSVTLDIPGVVVSGVVGPVTGDVTLAVPADAWRDALLDVAGGDLLAWYRMNEAGTVLVDSSGNGHDGVITHDTQGPTLAPPLIGTGGALDFGGNSSVPNHAGSAAVADGGWFNPSNGWTVGLWFDMPGGSTSNQQRIISKAGSFDAFISSLDSLVVAGTNSTTSLGGSTGSGTVGNGRHFMAWSLKDDATNAAGGAAMQGWLDATRFINNAIGAANTNTVDHAEPITFGYQNGNGVDPLFGAMDETFIIGRALTQSEIDELYVAGLASEVTVDGVVGPVTGSVTLTLPPNSDMTVDGLVAPVTGDVTVELSPVVTVDGVVSPVTGDVTLDLVPISFLTIDGVVGPVTGALDFRPPNIVTVDGLVPAVTGDVDLHGADSITIDGVVSPVTGSVTFAIPPQTDRGNRANGRVRGGTGVLFYEPPVDPPIDFSVADFAFVSARAFGAVTMDGAQPKFTVSRAVTPRLRDRIVVGGVDITHFRGVTTPAPTYSLVVPLLYGSGRLPLPQVSAAFEHAGHGDLSWAAKGSTVLVQRVDADNDVVATDYIGLVVAHDISGRNLVLELGGQATGRAAMIDKQPPLFFKRNDLGFWWWGAIQDLGLHFEPRLGPDTGIVLRNAGGMDHLSYVQDLSVKGARRTGAQLTCLPDSREDGGAYRVVEKDLTTISATVYLDDAVSVPDVRDDMAEQPNRVFATGVTPHGMRVKFGAYPVLSNATPPPYPMTDGSDFGIGTTDGDTDTGDGVSVMIWRLIKAGYLALEDKPGGYDSEVSDAIIDLKTDALDGDDTPTFFDGTMTAEAWAALFDASATGYSLAGTQILPAAQRSATRKWKRTSNGSVIARNGLYDPTVIPVDATIDAGVQMTRKQIRGFARGELTPVGENHYAGTITLNSGAVIRGEHTPGDAITEADIMDARELRPGVMNLWAPLFAGGTLFHISGIERNVPTGGGVETITVDVDTRARDTLKVWEVIARNRESRRSPARAWMNQHRSSTLTKDAVGEFDEIGGVLDDRVDLGGGAWTVFPTVAGQEGTIRSLRFETSPPTEFVVAVFAKEIASEQLADMIGNPLTKGGKKRWIDPTVRARLDRDFVLLYAAGEKRDPCGYFPGTKHPDDTTVDVDPDDATEAPDAAFLTGEWQDDAGFSYHMDVAPVLWVAIWAADAAHLSPGRVMWPQLEAGS